MYIIKKIGYVPTRERGLADRINRAVLLRLKGARGIIQ